MSKIYYKLFLLCILFLSKNFVFADTNKLYIMNSTDETLYITQCQTSSVSYSTDCQKSIMLTASDFTTITVDMLTTEIRYTFNANHADLRQVLAYGDVGVLKGFPVSFDISIYSAVWISNALLINRISTYPGNIITTISKTVNPNPSIVFSLTTPDPTLNKVYIALPIQNQSSLYHFLNGYGIELRKSTTPIDDPNNCTSSLSRTPWVINVDGSAVINLTDISIDKGCIFKNPKYTFTLYYDLMIHSIIGAPPKIIAKDMALSVTAVPPSSYEVKMYLVNDTRPYWGINSQNTKNDIFLPPKVFSTDVINTDTLFVSYNVR